MVTGEWRKLRNEELNDCSCPHIVLMIVSRRMRFALHVARSGVRGRACKVLMGKAEGRRPLGRPRLKWEDNVKMDI